MLFGPYLGGVTEITITDPYIRSFYQIRNIMEFLETVVKFKAPEDEVKVHLITRADDFERQKQQENLDRIIEMIRSAGVEFTWEFDQSQTIHARHIITDTGWKIDLDRGLDIFQKYEMNDALSLANRLQEFRQCKKFQVTYIMQGNED
jgi:ATP-dependent Lon protease